MQCWSKQKNISDDSDEQREAIELVPCVALFGCELGLKGLEPLSLRPLPFEVISFSNPGLHSLLGGHLIDAIYIKVALVGFSGWSVNLGLNCSNKPVSILQNVWFEERLQLLRSLVAPRP